MLVSLWLVRTIYKLVFFIGSVLELNSNVTNIFETFVTMPMEEGSTICFKNQNSSDQNWISIQLLSHQVDYHIVDQYSFNLPGKETLMNLVLKVVKLHLS